MSVGEWPGPVVHRQRPVARTRARRPRGARGSRRRGRPRRGRRATRTAAPRPRRRGCRWRSMTSGGELVVGLGLLGVAVHERRQRVQRRHLGARARRHQADQAQVVDVLVGDQQQLEVLDACARAPPGPGAAPPARCPSWGPRPPASAGRRRSGTSSRGRPRTAWGWGSGGSRPRPPRRPDRVRSCQFRPIFDRNPDRTHTGVEAHRFRAPTPVARVAARPTRMEATLQGLWAPARRRRCPLHPQERISPSTSSRFSSMCSRETSDSRFSRSSGSVFEDRTLKCQSS